MQTAKHFTSNFAMLAGISRLALGVALGVVPSCALDDGSAPDPSLGGDSDTTATDASDDGGASQALCMTGRFRCFARIQTHRNNRRITPDAAAPLAGSLGPPDLQSAYNINPTRLATATPPTVAIVDAFGYTSLAADLAVYRTQYGLPPCTVGNGCLTIVNQDGQPTPLPAQGTTANDLGWTVETALDVDMVSAACPLCKILVVQSANAGGNNLELGVATAARLGATVISNSWGGSEAPGVSATAFAQEEAYFNHPNIAVFASSGDHGYNNTVDSPANVQANGTGPNYPATSQYVIAVGATRLVKAPGTARGWSETAWAATAGKPENGAGGSACSLYTAKPAYQTASPCTKKATADIAAVGDPGTGVAVYNSTSVGGGWLSVGGTSASSPFVAAIFAMTGNGAQTSAQFVANNVAKLWDVTSGNNGTCGTQTLLCNAATGWDGPTGFGTPNVGAFMPAGTGGTGTGTGGGTGPGNGNGSNNGAGSSGGSGDNGTDITGGCSAGGTGAGLLLGVALLGLRRRRRDA